jgi:ribosomal protein L37AE/L43A
MAELVYDHTEYLLGEISDKEWEQSSLHSCPECNPSEHIKEKRGLYICAFCGRAWQNHFSRSKGEKDKGAIPETTLKSKGTLRGDEPYGDSPRAQLMDFSGGE